MAAPSPLLTQSTLLPPPDNRWGSGVWPTWASVTIGILLFATLSLVAAVKSPGFLESDACTHYLYARFALAPDQHFLFTDVWGRPFVTLVYSVPALIGQRIGVRAMSMMLAVCTALVTMRIAANQRYRWPALALIFFLAQPLVFLHSFSELTELPFALLMALAFWMYQTRRWFLLALVVGMMPTARPEGFGFILLTLLALGFHRRLRWAPLLFVPLMLWSLFGWLLCGHPQPTLPKIFLWLPEHWPYASESAYEKGPLLFFQKNKDGWAPSFLLRMPALVSPTVFPFVLLGIFLLLRRDAASSRQLHQRGMSAVFGEDHHLRCQWLITLLPLLIFAGHSFLYWRGKMASDGELRYLMVVSPFWALLGAAGWEWLFASRRWKGAVGWAAVAAVLPGLANVAYKVVPIRLTEEWIRAREVAQWYRSEPALANYPLLMTPNRAVNYFLDISMVDKRRTADWKQYTLKSPPNGVVLIWDPMYAVYNADRDMLMPFEEIEKAGWIPMRSFSDQPVVAGKAGVMSKVADQLERRDPGTWWVFLSPTDKDGHPTPRP